MADGVHYVIFGMKPVYVWNCIRTHQTTFILNRIELLGHHCGAWIEINSSHICKRHIYNSQFTCYIWVIRDCCDAYIAMLENWTILFMQIIGKVLLDVEYWVKRELLIWLKFFVLLAKIKLRASFWWRNVIRFDFINFGWFK